MPDIRILPDTLINQIAAGEVIERPASALKELIENALDAASTRVDITLQHGGKTMLRVEDNGHGMSRENLELCLHRHATSKIDGEDLTNLLHFGFRGEAIPAITSIADLSIISQENGANDAWEINARPGQEPNLKPAAPRAGTQVTITDIFSATPARLKFLKTDKSEYLACKDVITRIAFAHPNVAFSLTHNGQTILRLHAHQDMIEDPLKARSANIIGPEFKDNVMQIHAVREQLSLTGYASLPTYHRGTRAHQYLFVNGRAVKDRQLNGALQAAYSDVLARDRFPIAVLFLAIDPHLVDVNVHPAKAEVRFKDAGYIRALIIKTIREAIQKNGQNVSHSVTSIALSKLKTQSGFSSTYTSRNYAMPLRPSQNAIAAAAEAGQELYAPETQAPQNLPPQDLEGIHISEPLNDVSSDQDIPPLGYARAQIHNTYIISQTADGIILVDQHAAHERLVYERLKAEFAEHTIKAQRLLTPDIIELEEAALQVMTAHQQLFTSLGLQIEPFGDGHIAVYSVPALLSNKMDVHKLIHDLSDEIQERGDADGLKERIFARLSSAACHGSIRAGRSMRIDEMNALLRQMEETEKTAQCNHGRPTYVSLTKGELESLFGRK